MKELFRSVQRSPLIKSQCKSWSLKKLTNPAIVIPLLARKNRAAAMEVNAITYCLQLEVLSLISEAMTNNKELQEPFHQITFRDTNQLESLVK